MRRRLSKLARSGRAMPGLARLALALAPVAAQAKDKLPPDAFAASVPLPPPPPPANGSIFQGAYVPLTSGGRAGFVGDTITIQLVELTAATKSNAAGTQRDGDIGQNGIATGRARVWQYV